MNIDPSGSPLHLQPTLSMLENLKQNQYSDLVLSRFLESLRRDTTEGQQSKTLGALAVNEIWWRDRYRWLVERGYQLRSRFSPEWKPSWIGTDKYYGTCEDGIKHIHGQVIDATRISDGYQVALKHIELADSPVEADIMKYLSSESLKNDPRNHSVPLLELLCPPGDTNHLVLVQPRLRDFTSPPFETFGEVLECFCQIFEGLQFLYQHGVAHRDIKCDNIMMEWKDMFPKGYHFANNLQLPDLRGRAPFLTRTQRPPKYYIIDFGISRLYDPSNKAPLEPIIIGGDKSVPEFQNTLEPQNPFPTDVYYVGNMIRQEFIEGHPQMSWVRGYKEFKFLKPLIDDMVQTDPKARPTMDEVVRRFDDIVKGLSEWKLRSHTVLRKRNILKDPYNFAAHLCRMIKFTFKRTPAMPRP